MRAPLGAGDPIQVLLLVKGLGSGGTERLVSLSARVGDRDSFRYHVAYLLPWKRDLVEELEGDGVPVSCLGGGREWDLRWALRLRKLLRGGSIDVLHVHSPYVAAVARLVVRSMPRRARPRLIYTEHLPWWGYRRLTRLVNAATYPLDDAHLAVSDAVRDSIPALLRRRVSVILHGVALQEVGKNRAARKDVRKELGVRDDEVLFGIVAHYRPQKGYPVLLEAARRVLDAGVHARFLAIGDGPGEKDIRARHGALRLGDRFLLMGRRHDALRILSACDAFVLPSLYEGLPVALMEALALGLPVVSSAVPSIQQAMTDRREGLLVAPSDPDRLAGAIIELARDRVLRAGMGRAALEGARKFDIARAVAAVEAIYRAAVERIPSTAPART